METLKLLHPTRNEARRKQWANDPDCVQLVMPPDGRLEPSPIKAESPLLTRIDRTFAILSAVARKPKAGRRDS